MSDNSFPEEICQKFRLTYGCLLWAFEISMITSQEQLNLSGLLEGMEMRCVVDFN